jgi:Ribulose kinase
MKGYCIGVDYGTDSVRTIIVDASTGEEVAAAVFEYPRWKDGLFCDPAHNRFRQHPLDYIEGLEETVKRCLTQAGTTVRSQIKAISIDTTGSTPVAVDESGTPLALHAAFSQDPDAMFMLWKDHTAVNEAAAINAHAAASGTDYLRYVGGIYSSEWFWAKLLHVLRRNGAVRKACYSWVEHCDWMPFLLTGGRHAQDIRRSTCAAGHKALWAAEFGGWPANGFFTSLDPLLDGFTDRLPTPTFTADTPVGTLSAAWAQRLGLHEQVLVGAGAFDAHVGAVGGQIEPYYLSKVIGTSTCDMLVVPKPKMDGVVVRGICGQVDGSIIPGMIGLEAGQSAFGDTYAWFRNLLSWPLQHVLPQSPLISADAARQLLNDVSGRILTELGRKAAELPFDEGSELAVDWFNGRRTPDANQLLKGAISELSLGSDAPKIYRALVESTCFGARKIVERFHREGIPVKGIIGVGGIPRKSPFVMQMLADVLQMPIRVHRSEQTCALGAAMFAATVAGIYPRVEEAMAAMGSGFDQQYEPRAFLRQRFDARYAAYSDLCGFCEQTPP